MRCKHCQIKFDVKWFNQKYCMQTEQCIESAKNYAVDEVMKTIKKGWRERKVKLKEQTKKITDYENEAKKSFQLWIRQRDKDLQCISCGVKNTELWDGGHFFKAELFSGLIFDERNCHKQCRKCNRFLNGNELQYRKGLIERYGEPFVSELESISDANRVYKYSKTELIEIKNKYDSLNKLIK
jgi:hypothetical protein